MIYPLTDLNSWPLNLLGWPIFKSTNDAIFYAQLVYNDIDKQQALLRYRKETFQELKFLRESEDPDLDELMELAVKGQFFGEAHKEALRIKDETIRLMGG